MSRKKSFLAEFEEIVLLAVWRLGDEANATTIKETVENVAGRTTSIGAIYATLDRLEEKKYITIVQGEAKLEQGGRAKRSFKIEGQGIAALQEVDGIRKRLMPTRDLGMQT